MKRTKLLLCSAAAALLFSSPVGAQQVVKLTTANVGQSLTIVVNRCASDVTVDWGNGTAVAYPKGSDLVTTITGTPTAADITVTGPDQMTTLICENGGLTAVDLSGATGLKSLFLQNNSLSDIDVSACADLVDLDLSGNSLEAITLSSNTALENLNLANNNISKLGTSTTFNLRSNAALQQLNLSGNSFKTLLVTYNTALKSLVCDNLGISGLTLNKCPELTTVVCNDNSLTRISTDAETGQPDLQQIVCDNNNITSIDLSLSTNIKDISCAGNGMKELIYPNQKLGSMNCGDNALTFTSLPIAANQPEDGYFAYTPQAEIDLSDKLSYSETYGGYYIDQCPSYADRTNSDYQLDLSDQYRDKAKKIVTFTWYQVSNGESVALEKASASKTDLDYTATSGVFTFLNDCDGNRVYATLTDTNYPDLTLYTSQFVIGEENILVGINDVNVDNSESLDKAEIFDLQGRKVQEPANGIYIVNGKKMYINK